MRVIHQQSLLFLFSYINDSAKVAEANLGPKFLRDHPLSKLRISLYRLNSLKLLMAQIVLQILQKVATQVRLSPSTTIDFF